MVNTVAGRVVSSASSAGASPACQSLQWTRSGAHPSPARFCAIAVTARPSTAKRSALSGQSTPSGLV